MNLNNVNRRNTPEWCKFNENSREKINRENHVKQYGGSWSQNNKKEWVWDPNYTKVIQFYTPKKQRVLFEFTHKDGKVTITDNFTGFCRDNNINSSAMHDVIKGKRKQFKGYVVKRLAPEDN